MRCYMAPLRDTGYKLVIYCPYFISFLRKRSLSMDEILNILDEDISGAFYDIYRVMNKDGTQNNL